MHPDQRDDPGRGVTSAAGAEPPMRAASAQIGRELGGDLPCVICGYNLRGLSIRGVCPECGVNVKATILAVVDPQAAVLRPISRPRLVAGGLVLWSTAGLGAAVICWLPHLAAGASKAIGHVPLINLVPLVIALLAASAVGAATLIRPHAGIPVRHTAFVVIAVMLYAPLTTALTSLYAADWPASADGMRWTLIATGSLAGIFLLLRPMARVLVARSLLLRSGRVDRQTLYGMAAAAGLVAVGHSLLRISETHWVGGNITIRVLGVAVLVVGAALLTLGLLGSVIDCARIARAIVTPRRTVRDVVRSGIGPSPSRSIAASGPADAGPKAAT